MKKFYLAYGSNMDLAQMKRRCPDAILAGPLMLRDHRLLFKGECDRNFATIEAAPGFYVPCLVWEITPACEASLDVYEGFPRAYQKKAFYGRLRGGERIEAMAYVMDPARKVGLPSSSYFHVIQRAYAAQRFPEKILEIALAASWPDPDTDY